MGSSVKGLQSKAGAWHGGEGACLRGDGEDNRQHPQQLVLLSDDARESPADTRRCYVGRCLYLLCKQ